MISSLRYIASADFSFEEKFSCLGAIHRGKDAPS
jgi:hypothetical protein